MTYPTFLSKIFQAIRKGTVDGVFIPHGSPPPSASQLEKARVYPIKAPGGTLYFRRDAWRNYGANSEEEFHSFIHRRTAVCNTPEGIISLGGALSPRGRDLTISVFLEDYFWRLSFLCKDEAEASATCLLLQSILPGCELKVAPTGFRSLLSGLPSTPLKDVWALIKSPPAEKKDTLLFLYFLAAATMAAALHGWFAREAWLPPLAGILFAIIVSLICINVGKQNHQRTKGRMGTPKKAQV